MMSRKYLFTILLLYLQGFLLFSQSLKEKEVLVKMNEVYINATSFSMDVKIDMFEKEQQQPYQNMNGSLKKSGHLFYSSMMDRITINNDNCFLVVDGLQKKIYYNKDSYKGNKSQPAFKEIMPGLDSTLVNCKMRFIKSIDDNKYYRLELVYKDNPEYKRIEMLVNKTSFALEQLVYYYKEQEDGSLPCEKIVITYLNVKLNILIDKNLFSEDKFVKKVKGKIMPAEKYSGYEMIYMEQQSMD